MESPLVSPYPFSASLKNEKKGHLPIRSITYKKNLSIKDLDAKKDMLNTLTKFPNSPFFSVNGASPTRASTHHGSKPDSATYQPFMSCTFHKLSMASTKETPRKFQSTLLPHLRSARTPPAHIQTSNLYNYGEHHNQLQRSKTKDVLHAVSAQEDYFKLLFDENRKTFKVEDYEGVDEYYTDDMIKTRIYSQGFRDPDYFSKRNEFVDLQIPNEQTIREEYRLKIPAIVSTMENTNTLATHLLGGTVNNITFVESTAQAAEQELKNIKAEKKQIQKEIEDIKKRFENEVKNIEAGFSKRFEQLQSRIKEDFISSQNENFKLQKEIVLLQRDKLRLEKEIEESLVPLHRLEDTLYGREIFTLEPNEERLNHVSDMNLRPEVQSSMKNKRIIH